jgi:hypothetical protein
MVPGGEIWGRLSFFPLWHRIRLENSYALAIEMRPDPVSPRFPSACRGNMGNMDGKYGVGSHFSLFGIASD